MSRRKIRKLYERVSREYRRGIVDGLNGTVKPFLGTDPDSIAYNAGHEVGSGIRHMTPPRKQGEAESIRVQDSMPTKVWSLVLAESLRPRG